MIHPRPPASTASGSALLQTRSAKILSRVLDQDWRGAYDILVRPAGQDLATASTSEFVEGNFVAVTGKGGISLGQLKAIRKIDAVGVAAPIGSGRAGGLSDVGAHRGHP